jgi:hypothetical protein
MLYEVDKQVFYFDGRACNRITLVLAIVCVLLAVCLINDAHAYRTLADKYYTSFDVDLDPATGKIVAIEQSSFWEGFDNITSDYMASMDGIYMIINTARLRNGQEVIPWKTDEEFEEYLKIAFYKTDYRKGNTEATMRLKKTYFPENHQRLVEEAAKVYEDNKYIHPHEIMVLFVKAGGDVSKHLPWYIPEGTEEEFKKWVEKIRSE